MDIISEFIKMHFPTSDIVNQQVIKKNYKSTLLKLESFLSPAIMVKIYENNGYSQGVKEYQVLCQLQESKFNCPQPIKQVDDNVNKKYYIFMNYIEGITLAALFYKNKKIDLRILHAYCKQILLFHKVPISDSLYKLLQKENYFQKRINFCLLHSEFFAQEGLDVDFLFAQIEKKAWPLQASIFIHGDYHFGNVIQTENNQLYVVDFEESFYSDFYVELARIIMAKDIYTGKVLLSIFQRIEEIDERRFYQFILLELMNNIAEYYHFISTNISSETTIERYHQYFLNLRHYEKMAKSL